MVKVLKAEAEDLYNAFDRFQPFRHGNEWLGYLMKLSNHDKHVIVNEIVSPTLSSFVRVLPNGTQIKSPAFMGEKLVIFSKDGPIVAKLPYYFHPLKAFATPRKN